jgi:hypothetical protein
MTVSINVAGTWKDSPGIDINVAGVWKVATPSINVAGVWKDVGGLSISPVANGDYNFRSSGTVYGGVRWDNNGTEYEYTNTGGISSQGPWLDSGTAAEVWVQFVRTAGLANWDVHPGTGRYNLATDRMYYITRSSSGSESISGYFRFYDAASGGTLLAQTSTATWDIEQGTA